MQRKGRFRPLIPSGGTHQPRIRPKGVLGHSRGSPGLQGMGLPLLATRAQATINDNAVEVALRDAGWDITGLSGQDLPAVQDLVSQAIDEGWTDERLSRNISPIIGLGPRYTQAVTNLRAGLKAQGLPASEVDRQVAAYSDRAKQQRADMVAGHEVRTSLSQAQRDYWREQQSTGNLSQYAVRIWNAKPGACPECRALNGKRSSIGTDVNAPPLHPNCRCSETVSDQGITKSEMRLPKGPHGGEWTKGEFTWDQKRSLKNYTGFGYGAINGVCRGNYTKMNKERTDETNRDIANIDSAMSPIPAPMTVWRGMGSEAFGGLPVEGWAGVKGKTFTDKGFVSTSTSQRTGESWDFKGAVAEVHLPVGIPAIVMPEEGVSSWTLDENEVLLGRGLKYTITDVKPPEGINGHPHLVIEVSR